VEAQVGVPPADDQPAADRQAAKGVDDEQVSALIQTESFKVDSRQR
jgi:hypothetical protein